jgi:hypothetical protein
MKDIKTIDIDEAAEMLDDEMQEMQHNGWDDSDVVYAKSMAEVARQLGVNVLVLEVELKAEAERVWQENKPEFSWNSDTNN